MPSIDPTSAFFEAIRAYLRAVDPRFPIEQFRLIGRDGNEICRRVSLDLTATLSQFVPNAFQQGILDALEGKALRAQALGAAVGDKSRLYKAGGLNELREHGLVDLHDRLGYFRPDAPPPDLN